MTHGFCDRLRPISDLQLPVNILHLAFDLNFAPEQLLPDLFIRPSLRRKLYTLDLRRAETPIQAILLFSQSMKLDYHLCNRLGFTENSLTAMHRSKSTS